MLVSRPGELRASCQACPLMPIRRCSSRCGTLHARDAACEEGLVDRGLAHSRVVPQQGKGQPASDGCHLLCLRIILIRVQPLRFRPLALKSSGGGGAVGMILRGGAEVGLSTSSVERHERSELDPTFAAMLSALAADSGCAWPPSGPAPPIVSRLLTA